MSACVIYRDLSITSREASAIKGSCIRDWKFLRTAHPVVPRLHPLSGCRRNGHAVIMFRAAAVTGVEDAIVIRDAGLPLHWHE
jgi:hypothetical protein